MKNHKFMIRKDQMKIETVHSPSYGYFPNVQALEMVLSGLENDFRLEWYKIRGRKMDVGLARPEESFIIPTDRKPDGELITGVRYITNSEDSSTRLLAGAGLYTFICTNGMRIGNEYELLNIMHRGDVTRKIQSQMRMIDSVDLTKVLHFPRGIIGFENHREFVLLQLKEDSPFLMLQAMNDPKVGLMVADPFSFTTDYEIKVADAEQKLLQIEDPSQVAVLVTVTIPHGAPERTALNLSGPILVNYGARIGLQVPQVDTKYPAKLFLSDLSKQQQG